MKKIFVVVFLLVILFLVFKVNANIDDEINANNKLLQDVTNEYNGAQISLQQLLAKLNEVKINIRNIEEQINQKAIEVRKGDEALTYQKELLNERAKSYYKNANQTSNLFLTVLVSNDLSTSLRKIFYQKSLEDNDKNVIIKVVLYIKNLEKIKANLETQQAELNALKQKVDQQSKDMADKVAALKNTIAALTAKQQQLISQKLASLGISRSASSMGRCDSDLTNGRDPGFSPKFAFFTYGVPNRVGLNQYGAKGRAEAGQSYETILRAYYNFDEIKSVNSVQINVDGHGSYSLEDYVKRIYEVPGDWPGETLKAQAIAARSYALAYTNNGANSICATESCQVFQDNPKGGAWEQAVNDTSGKVMVQGGNPIKAWFSSTHGGYIFSSSDVGWSGTSWTKHANDFDGNVNSFSDLASKAYDRDSPWFYCDWGSRSQYNKTAWLKPEELADIVNTILLAKIDSSVREHLYQPDNPPSGTDNWGPDRVRQELRSRGQSPFNTISGGSISADFSQGRVSSVSFSGDGGNITFSLSEFKDWFNLRAPANIQIVGPLFNIEKR